MAFKLTLDTARHVGINSLISAGGSYLLSKVLGGRVITWGPLGGGAVAGGVTLFATLCEAIYQRQFQDKITPPKSLLSYTLAGMVIAIGRAYVGSNFPLSAIAGLTALSYLTKWMATTDPGVYAVAKEDLSNSVYSATLLSWAPEYNIYQDAEKMRKARTGHGTPEWKHFVEKATGDLSLKAMALSFASKLSSQTLFQWNLKSRPTDWVEASCFKAIETVKQGENDVNADDAREFFLAHKGQNITVFSIADGSGPGQEPALIAKAANLGFVEYVKSAFSEGPITPAKLAEWAVLAVDAAQMKTLTAKHNNRPANACTTHLGVIVATDENLERAHCCFTSVGDCALWVKFPNGSVANLTYGINRPSVTDPGGQLGRKYQKEADSEDGIRPDGEIPDLRNFTVGYVSVPKGSAVILMTDGVYDNVTSDEIQTIIRNKTCQDAVDAIVALAKQKATQPGGKPDDISCAWIVC